MAEDCIFCRIIKGEIPSTKVYEDDKMIAINDVAPAASPHPRHTPPSAVMTSWSERSLL